MRYILKECIFFLLISWGGVRPTWYVSQCLAYCNSPRWLMVVTAAAAVFVE
jgi:hypothetical protein